MREIKEVEKNNHCRISAFKHCGSNYRNWSPIYKLEEEEDFLLYYSPRWKTKVYQKKGNDWRPNFSSVWVFPKHKFYNVVCILKDNKVYYYINVSSKPSILKHRVGFIDYDVDFRIDIDGNVEKRDENEFLENIKKYGYCKHLTSIVREAEKQILMDYNEKKFPFDCEHIKNYLLKKEEEHKNEKRR